jgi:hypothetical protein
MPNLSVILRNIEGEDINRVIKSVRDSSINNKDIEIIVVSYSKSFSDYFQDGVHFLLCDAKRLEAKLLGVQAAKSEKILFLDSDQTVSLDLIQKVINFEHKVGIIPERSSNVHFMARLMDAKRKGTEKLMLKHPGPELPVLPRLFCKGVIESALTALGDDIIKNATWPEDSLIYYETTKVTKDIAWVNSYIFNLDPSLKNFVRKSFYYGLKNEQNIIRNSMPEEYKTLIRKIQFETLLNNRSLSVGMMLCNIIRGVPFLLGSLRSKFGRSLE